MKNSTKQIRIYTICAPADRDAAQTLQQTLSEKNPYCTFLPECKDEPLYKVWCLRVTDRIRQADLVVCLVGESSWLYTGVNWEITLSLKNHKSLFAMSLSGGKNVYMPPFVLIDKDIDINEFSLKLLNENILMQLAKLNMRSAA